MERWLVVEPTFDERGQHSADIWPTSVMRCSGGVPYPVMCCHGDGGGLIPSVTCC